MNSIFIFWKEYISYHYCNWNKYNKVILYKHNKDEAKKSFL